MEPITLKISDKFIAKKKKVFLVIQIIVPFFVGLILLADKPLFVKLFSFIFFVVFIETILIIQPRLMFKKMKETEIKITDEGIERVSGTFAEKILFSDISRVVLTKDKTGKILLAGLQSFKGAINIFGYENINSLVDSLNSKIDPSKISEKKYSRWKGLLHAVGSIICLFVFWLILQKAGLGRFFGNIGIILIGLFTLIYKPMSKNWGLRFRKLELILSIAIIIIMALSILRDIVGKEFAAKEKLAPRTNRAQLFDHKQDKCFKKYYF